jgi:hypothetical protein
MKFPWKRRTKIGGPLVFPRFLPILEELAASFQEITDEDLRRCERHMRPATDAEAKLGVVHNLELRRLWALSFVLQCRSAEENLYAEAKCHSETEAAYHREGAARADALGDCVKELFWTQAREDIGGEAWQAKNLGIRSGWMLVARPAQAGLPSFLQFLGGPPA